MSTRETKNALAFLETVAETGGFQLRPVGYLTIQKLQLLDMKIGAGDEARAALSHAEMLDQINAFLFIQAAPPGLVAKAVRAYRAAVDRPVEDEKAILLGSEAAWEDFLDAYVEPFLASLPPDAIAAAQEQLEQLPEIDAARVDAEPPKHHKRERHDPNSSSQAG